MTLDGVECAIELEHLGVRHTMPRLTGGMGVVVLGMMSAPFLLASGFISFALSAIGAVIVLIAAFSTSMGSELVVTRHTLRVGRVERPRAAWGRFDVIDGNELVLNHVRPGGGREWWVVSERHRERLQWFVEQSQVVQSHEQGSASAVPDGLERMVARNEPE